MARKKRTLFALLLSLVCAASLFAAVACSDNGETTAETYSVTYAAGAEDATGSVSVESYAAGTPFVLRDVDTFTRPGYTFTQWSDGTSLYDAGDMYTMPAHDVTFTAQWEENVVQPAPEGAEQVSDIAQSTLVTRNGSAAANWFAEYTDAGLHVTAWVADTATYTNASNVYSSDAVEVIFANVANVNGYTENTVSVIVTAGGLSLVRNLYQGTTATIEGLTTSAAYLTIDGTTLAGWCVEITMPYAAIGVTQADKDAALALGLINASNAGDAEVVYEQSLSTDPELVRTYIALTADNTFEENYYAVDRSFWGSAGGMQAANSWDTTHDNGEDDAYIAMTGNSGDNFIYMRQTGDYTTYYAEVQLTVQEVMQKADGTGYDGYPKFGMTLFSSNGTNGVFYFVDAIDGDSADGVINSDSIDVGYNVRANGAWGSSWTIAGNLGTGATSGDYQNGNYITLGIYRQGSAVRLLVDGESVAVLHDIGIEAGESAYIGLASFNLSLRATGYKIVTDPAELAQYEIEVAQPPLKAIDGSLSDWTNAQKNNPFIIPSTDGSSVTVYAAMDANGINIFYDVYHKDHKTTETDWWMNTNVEFRLGGDAQKQYAVAANGYLANIQSEYVYMSTTQEESGLYHTVAEIFIPYTEVNGYGASSASIPANFYFKVGNMYGNPWYTGDWWRATDGNEQQGTLITHNGIKGGSAKTIDGLANDWDDAAWTTSGRSQWAATLEEDGLYVIVRLSQADISPDRAFVSGADGSGDAQWWLNQNVEVQTSDNVRPAKIIYMNGAAYHTGYINDAAAVYTAGEGGANDTLVFEFFISYENMVGVNADSEYLSLSFGGQLFADATSTTDVWQTYASNALVLREGYHAVSFDGVAENEPSLLIVADGSAVGTLPQAAERSGYTFDGWYVNDQKIDATYEPAGNVTAVARYSPVAPVITFSSGEANDTTRPAPTATPVWNADDGAYTLTLPANTYFYEGYAFQLWSVQIGSGAATNYEAEAEITLAPGSTVTITAIWAQDGNQMFTVSFDIGFTGVNVETPSSVQVEEGTAIGTQLPAAPARNDTYIGFLGWFYGENLENQLTADTVVNSDIAATAKWRTITEAQDAIDYLFIGASTISTEFWYTYEATFGSLDAVNLAVPGYKISDWLERLTSSDVLKYNPTKIIMHIGLNDVNDAQHDAQTVIADLEKLFAGLQEIYPDANLYYVTIIKNVAFSQNTATYAAVNSWVDGLDDVELIDVAQYITTGEDGVAEMQWFVSDGLHPSVDGYAVFHREIVKALGLEYTETGAGLGDTAVEGAPQYGHTAGWKYDSETQIWHHENEGQAGIEKLMIGNAYGATLYAEAQLSIAGMYNDEANGKAGLAISSNTVTYFFYIDLSDRANPDGYTNHWGSVAYRPEVQNGKNWVYPEDDSGAFRPFGGNGYANLGDDVAFDHNTNPDAYIRLGVAKVNDVLYFFSGDTLIGSFGASMFAADEEVAVSVFGLNTDMYVKGATAITDAEQINAKLPAAHEKTIDGSMSDWEETDKTNPVVMTGAGGKGATVYATLGSDGMYIFYDVNHGAYITNHKAWHENSNVEIRVGSGATQFFYSANGDHVGFATGDVYMKTVQEGGLYHTVVEAFIPFTHGDLAGYSANSAYVPAGFAWKTLGDLGGNICYINEEWWRADDPANRLVLVTSNGIRKAAPTAKAIDGSNADWSDASWTTSAGTKAGVTAQYTALLADDGLYFIIRITAASIDINKQETSRWHLNTNLEFFSTDNSYTGRIVAFGGDLYYTGMFDAVAQSFTDGETEDTWTVEFFIANEHMKNVTSSTQSISINFGGQLYGGSYGSWQDYARGITVARSAAAE